MKAIDIATKNHISINDLFEVCKTLEIKYEDENSTLSTQDVFLIEKKIEGIKARNAKTAEQQKKGKKIKLKRKVHVSKSIKDKKSDGNNKSTAKKEVPSKIDGKPANADGKKPETKSDKFTKGKDSRSTGRSDNRNKNDGKPGQSRPGFKKESDNRNRNKPDDKNQKIKIESIGRGEKPVALEVGSDSKKRKKGKGKEKEDRSKYKKSQAEKAIRYKKKTTPQVKREAVTPDEITITENISIGELARKLNVKANEVIAKMMKLGEMVTINQVIDTETAEILAGEYGTEVKIVSLYDETVIKHTEEDKEDDYITRPPVVTIMGHVDHGKTKLLDAIRETDVVAGEHGGITQHIGAYLVHHKGKEIAFLDTPGHAAFTTMRARGAEVTDIVILVVAANDGVMPQTIEAINHAKDADVPIIVAINKIDLEDANPQKVRQELSNYGLQPEEWGGTTLFAEISAKQKINLDGLLELVTMQAEMLELKSNPKIAGRGTVIEAKLDPGRGSVVTVLIQKGTLKIGDPFVVGIFSGKVRAMFNDHGKAIKKAGPSHPVEVLGISGVPGAGDPFEGVDSEKTAKQISQKRLEFKRIESAKKVKKVTLESLNEMIKEGDVQDIHIIVKADVDGSAQALKESLEKLSTNEIRVKVIHTGTGGINESDVMLASASSAIIIGYHVRPTGKVTEIADRENVSIKFYNIIFEATDDIKAAMEGMLSPEIKEEILGTGEIKQVFKISKIGSVAGAIMESGKVLRSSKIRLIRDGVVIFDGELKSLKRFKDEAKEVTAGQEFGFGLEGYNDIKESDRFEAYELKEFARTL